MVLLCVKVSFRIPTICLRLHVAVKRHLFRTQCRRDVQSQLCSHREYGCLHKHYIRRVTANRQSGRDGWICYLHSILWCGSDKMKVRLRNAAPRLDACSQSSQNRRVASVKLESGVTSARTRERRGGEEGATSRSPSGLIITGRNLGVRSPLTRGDFFCFEGRKSLCLTPLH